MSNQGSVKFIQYHQPSLESGEYRLSIEQTIESSGKIRPQTYTREITFAVQGERFSPLSPEDIYAVFPPQDSLGLHDNVLPHITVKRSTLPWERYPGTTDENLPWLILILFRDSDFESNSDKPKPQNITLQNLQQTNNIKFPNISLEVGQTDKQQVTVIDVKKKYLQPILPTKSDLAYLSHVRQREYGDGNASEDEFATIICNRLPEANGISTVHLVSVEGRYDSGGNFDYQGATDEDKIRLVSLASWSFACIDKEQSFTQILKKLNRNPSAPRLPQNSNSQAEQNLAMGYIPLPHSLRKGSHTVSWYRGPLIPGNNSQTHQFPIQASDELLRYDHNLGLFDTSYAAAWQLGRMLTLQNQKLAIDLYNWKRTYSQQLRQLEQEVSNLPLTNPPSSEAIPIPQNIQDWFKSFELLQNIPFNYLVPDERLLPPESIRFFWVDPLWIDCLQDGAFSIGRVTNANHQDDQNIRNNANFSRNNNQQITGIILRSQVVPGWPSLIIDGYEQVISNQGFVPSENALSILRLEKLAQDVLICLFAGEVKTVDFHLKPETMHFGLDPSLQTKKLRTVDGEPIKNQVPVPWNNQQKAVINVNELAQNMKQHLSLNAFNSARFALQMIEGVQKVRFVFGD